MNDLKAIQIIGTQRSGSNLLRVMLDTLDGVFAPHPPHILHRFLPLLSKYGSFESEAARRMLIHDVCEMVRINPVPWNVTLDEDEIAKECEPFSLYKLYRIVYETAARQNGASIWINKSMQNVHYAEGLEASGLHPVYLYLFRDGRDVALSFKKAIVGEKHIYCIARSWKKDQAACIRLKASTDPSRFVCIRYEDLITDSESELRKICNAVDIPYESKALEYYRSSESDLTSAAGKMWENVKKPVMKDNKNKFLKELSPEEIAIFESVAGEELKALGYELVTPEEQLRTFSPEEIGAFEAENEALKKQFMSQADEEDVRKRQPQDDLIRSIKQR